MKTENHSINDVLAKNATSFFIPPFQRAYAWGKPEIERYFSDILRIINSELDTNSTTNWNTFSAQLLSKKRKLALQINQLLLMVNSASQQPCFF